MVYDDIYPLRMKPKSEFLQSKLDAGLVPLDDFVDQVFMPLGNPDSIEPTLCTEGLTEVERVCELLGPLCGQRSASRAWYETVAGWLTSDEMGFVQGENEPCVFRNDGTGMRVVLYVDDLLCRGPQDESDRFHLALGERFTCRGCQSQLSPDNPIEF